MDDLSPSPVEFVGPFQHHEVVVDGWSVPLLEAHPQPGGKVVVSLDQRYQVEMSLTEADRFLPFVANAIAVALGFACHPNFDTEPKNSPPLLPRRTVGLDWLQTGSDV